MGKHLVQTKPSSAQVDNNNTINFKHFEGCKTCSFCVCVLHSVIVTLIAHNMIQVYMHLKFYTGTAVNGNKISNGEIALQRSNDHGIVIYVSIAPYVGEFWRGKILTNELAV